MGTGVVYDSWAFLNINILSLQTHLPGYVRDFEKLKGEGINVVACISVNDAYVMASWGKDQNTDGKIRMLADTNGEFTKVWYIYYFGFSIAEGTESCYIILISFQAVDLGVDVKGLGGLRSKRYDIVCACDFFNVTEVTFLDTLWLLRTVWWNHLVLSQMDLD